MDTIAVLLPVFAVIALGWGAVRLGFIDPHGVRGMNDFTVRVAFPALLFGALAEEQSLEFMGIASVYLAGCLVVYVIALLLAHAILKAHLSQAAAFALNATYGGVAYVAMPIVVAAFGAAGLVLILPIIALHSAVILPLAAVLIEVGLQRERGVMIRSTLQSVLRNPIVMSIALGFAWHFAHLPVPAPLHALLQLVGKAAPALALFCVGASLPVAAKGFVKEATLAVGLKLLLLPTVIGALSFLAGLSGLPVKVALVAAAMPTGANAFLVASRAVSFNDASAAIVVTTLAVSAPLLTGLLLQMG